MIKLDTSDGEVTHIDANCIAAIRPDVINNAILIYLRGGEFLWVSDSPKNRETLELDDKEMPK